MSTKIGILIIEDSKDDIFFFKRAWSKAGIQIPFTHVSDGDEALQYFSEIRSNPLLMPRVCLTDLKLPGRSGFELLQYLQDDAIFDGMIKLVWSSSNDINDVRQAYDLGARCYLPKPESEQTWRLLVARIREFYSPAVHRPERPIPSEFSIGIQSASSI